MGLVDIHVHEPDMDWHINVGKKEHHHHDEEREAAGESTPEGTTVDTSPSGPNPLALAVLSLVFALLTTGVVIALKKKFGERDDSDLDLDVQ